MDASEDTTQESLPSASCQQGTADCGRLADVLPIDGCGLNQAAIAIGQHCSEQQRRCLVCNDVALGNNFGILSCESCKAFFRRTAVKEKIPRCVFTGNCLVNEKTRRFCSACRLQKSFAVGMKKEMILGDSERIRRKNLVEQNKAKKSERLHPYRMSRSSSEADGDSSQLSLPQVPSTKVPLVEDLCPELLLGAGRAPAIASPCLLQPELSPVAALCSTSEAVAAAAAAGSSCLPLLMPSPGHSDASWPLAVNATDPPQLAPQSSGHLLNPVVAVDSFGFAAITAATTASDARLQTPTLVRRPPFAGDGPDTSSAIDEGSQNLGTLTVTLHGGSSHFSAAELPPLSPSAPHERSSKVAPQPVPADCGGSSQLTTLTCAIQSKRQLTGEQQSTIAMLRSTYVDLFGYAADEVYQSRPHEYLQNFEDALNHSTNLIRHIVRFAKSVPEFCLAPAPVQLALLKGAALPCILLHLAALYDPLTESWGLGYDGNGEVCGRIPVDYAAGVLSSMGSDGVQRHKALMISLKSQLPTVASSSGVAEATDCHVTALLLVLLLLSPEHAVAAGAGNRGAGDEPDGSYCDAAADLSDAQQRYTDLLGGYVQATQSYSRAAELLPLMLHLLSSVKQYGRLSLQRIAAACDPSRVDPLLQEVFNLRVDP